MRMLTTAGPVDNEAEMSIAKLAKTVVNRWSPDGLDGKLLVPGLGVAACPAAAPSM